jgi:hypothetical protein
MRHPTLFLFLGIVLAGAGLLFPFYLDIQRLSMPHPTAYPARESAAAQPADDPFARKLRLSPERDAKTDRATDPRKLAVAEAARIERVLQAQLSGLRNASYAFNHPNVMYVTRRSQITFALATAQAAAVLELQRQFEAAPEGAVQSGKTKYAPTMVATLRGLDFKIEPSGPQERTVLLKAAGPTQWTWVVEPLEAGHGKLLVLELSALLARGNDTLPPVTLKTFQARINVDVKTFDRFLLHARRMTPIAQAMTGVGGLIAVFGFIGTVGRWLRRPSPA